MAVHRREISGLLRQAHRMMGASDVNLGCYHRRYLGQASRSGTSMKRVFLAGLIKVVSSIAAFVRSRSAQRVARISVTAWPTLPQAT